MVTCIIVAVSIQELSQKFKGFLCHEDTLLAGLIVLVSVTSFYIGRESIVPRGVQRGEESAKLGGTLTGTALEYNTAVASSAPGAISEKGAYVASKSGTKYHLPWCPGAKQIKESNKIYFASKEDAEAKGYTPATNCKGI